MVIVMVFGNLGGDPETRFSPSGQKIVSFSVASNSKRKGKDETTWWRITIFGDRFDKMLTYLKKGSSVIVSGEMSIDTWTDRDGRQQTSNSVIADGIKFNPFGRSDRPQDQSQSQSHAAPGAFTTPAYSAPGAFSAQGFAPQQQQPYMPPQSQHMPSQPQAYSPAPMQDFSFGEPSEALMHSDHQDEPPF